MSPVEAVPARQTAWGSHPAIEAIPEGTRKQMSDYGVVIYQAMANRPRNKAECQRYTNQPVVSVRRGTQGTVGSFTYWDGESYHREYGYFCSNDCAAKMGRRYMQRLGR